MVFQKSKARVNLQALATGKKSCDESGSGMQALSVIEEEDGDEENGEEEEVGSQEVKEDIERVSYTLRWAEVKAD
jgi:hypothetical protein